MFFYLTNVILDITLGVSWWLLKTTGYVVYNGVLYIYKGSNENVEPEKYNLYDSVVVLDGEEILEKLASLP